MAWWARASRRHALTGGSHPLAGRTGGPAGALLLAWLVASAALLAFVLVIDLGGDAGCTGRATGCGAQASARDHAPAVPVSKGQVRPSRPASSGSAPRAVPACCGSARGQDQSESCCQGRVTAARRQRRPRTRRNPWLPSVRRGSGDEQGDHRALPDSHCQPVPGTASPSSLVSGCVIPLEAGQPSVSTRRPCGTHPECTTARLHGSEEEAMTSTLTPTCAFCGLRFDSRPLLELHVREDHAHLDRPAAAAQGGPDARTSRPRPIGPPGHGQSVAPSRTQEPVTARKRATDPPAAYRAGDGRPAPGGWCLPARQRGTTAGVGCHAAPGGRTAAPAPGRHARRAERSVDGRQRPYRPRGMTSCPACLGRPGARRRRIAYPVAAPA